MIEHLQRVLQFDRDDSPEQKLDKLEQALSHSRLNLQETVPLLASLLSLPASRYTLPVFSPQKQKQKTQEVLVAWMIEEAEKAAVYCAWEDLHWADPSTLEFLTLYLEQIPTTRTFTILTFRPDFTPPWGSRSYLTPLTLSRLGRSQVEAMVEKVTGGKALPPEVVQQIVAKTDGVPLFVEELTKMVLESGLPQEEANRNVGARLRPGSSTGQVPLPTLGIPATLQDALMARLDRLGMVKEVAQLGATLGREFSYDLLHAVSPLDEGTLQQGLRQLVEAELVYQRGLVPQATYLFKHALIQDAAYQSLLKSRRQQLHQQVAQVLEEKFSGAKEIHPELLAHHYTEAGLIEQAIPYWQQAGERASQRSAYVEAVAHLTRGLEVLKALPDTPEHIQQELTLQTILGPVLLATKGFTVPEVKQAYDRALELCGQIGETPQLFPVLRGLQLFYMARAEHQKARTLAEQLLSLAQRLQDPLLVVGAHMALGQILFFLGEFSLTLTHMEQGIALSDPQQHRDQTWSGGHPGVQCLGYAAWALWYLGYPDQALKKGQEALTLAKKLSHRLTLATALHSLAQLHQIRREEQATRERAEENIALSTEHGFAFYVVGETSLRGWALAEQGQREEGIAQMSQGLATWQALGAGLGRPLSLAHLAEAYGKVGKTEEGLSMLAEAQALVDKTRKRFHEAELYRIKGELTLQQFNVQRSKLRKVRSPEFGVRSHKRKIKNQKAKGKRQK